MNEDANRSFCPECKTPTLQSSDQEGTLLNCTKCCRRYYLYKGDFVLADGSSTPTMDYRVGVSKQSKQILIHKAECVRCRACLAICPFHAITEDSLKKEIVIKEEICTQCGRCIEVCNYEAIGYYFADK